LRLIDNLIGAARGGVKAVFELLPRRFKACVIGIGGDPQRLGSHAGAAAERQIDGGAVPIVEIGRPDICASLMMPGPAIRGTFGTSAESATE
jgi:hypothetical protein